MMVCCAFVGRPTADCRAGVGPISSCFFLFLRPTTTVAVTHRVHSETHRIVPIPSTRSVSRSPPFTFLRTASKSTQVRVRARASPVCLAMMSKVKKNSFHFFPPRHPHWPFHRTPGCAEAACAILLVRSTFSSLKQNSANASVSPATTTRQDGKTKL